jgi:hypothetical protein
MDTRFGRMINKAFHEAGEGRFAAAPSWVPAACPLNRLAPSPSKRRASVAGVWDDRPRSGRSSGRPRKTGPKPGKNPPKRAHLGRFRPAFRPAQDASIALIPSRESVRTRNLDYSWKVLKAILIMTYDENWPATRNRCISLIANLIHPGR